MNILVPDSWLREYLETDATPQNIMECLSLCGPSAERIIKQGNDFIYDIEITSNRVDMASVYGIARETAAILPRFKVAAKIKPLKLQEPEPPEKILPLEISDPEKLCSRILGIVMEVDKVTRSPDYISDRIEKSGVRTLNNLIDITNYVMLELGHPTHVFDYDKVQTHKFLIRKAKNNEPIITLDGKKYLLGDQDIVIDDQTGRIIDLPGIMGTANSVVGENTRRIIFFIESNNPNAIRRTSLKYGIRTMAATINEKHPNPELARDALLRGIELYGKIAGARISSSIIDIFPNKPEEKHITVTAGFINEKLGIKISATEIEEILTSLNFFVKNDAEDSFIITPPDYRRFDINIPEDIVEEVARIYGYHNLPSRLMSGPIPLYIPDKFFELESKIKNLLKYTGFTECYHYSFISKKLIEKAGLRTSNHLKIANPLTHETEFMRTSLVPSMLETVVKNRNQENLQLFELSKIYKPENNDLPVEENQLVIATTGNFYKLKGYIEAVFHEAGCLGLRQVQVPADNFFHPKQNLSYFKNNDKLATLGLLNPILKDNFGIDKQIYLGIIYFDNLLKYRGNAKKYKTISPYPEAIEDLTLIVPDEIPVGKIIKTIADTDPKISQVTFREKFNGTVTFNIHYHDNSQNITASGVRLLREKILKILKEKYNIALKETM